MPAVTSTPTVASGVTGTPTLHATGTPTLTPTSTSTSGGGGGAATKPTATPALTATSAAAAGVSAIASPTSTSTPSTPGGGGGGIGTGPEGGVVPTPPPGRFTSAQTIVLSITLRRLQDREATQPSAPVQVPSSPPVQVPSAADGDNLWDMIASFFEAQPLVIDQASPCELGVSITNSVSPNQGQVGDTVNYSYTLTNDGTLPLTDVQVDSTLPSGVTFVSANDGGSVDPDTGYVGWALAGGLDVGASTSLSITATIAEPGSWDNTVCAVGHDALDNEDDDCATSTLIGGVPTPTPTATVTATVTVTTTPGTPTPGTPTPEEAVIGTATPGTPTPGATNTPLATSTPLHTTTPQTTSTPPPTTTPHPHQYTAAHQHPQAHATADQHAKAH